MYSILPLVLVVLSSVQIIFLWEEEPLKTLKRIICRFLWLSPITSQKKLPKKRKANKLQEAGPLRCLFLNLEEWNYDSEETDEEMEIDMDYSV